MVWIQLIIAGMLEVFWATMMKLSNGFTKLGFTILTITGMILSFYFLAKAIKVMPMSLAYPVWTGIGAVGSIIVGLVIFRDHLSPLTTFFVCLLIIGIIGIKVTSGH